MYGMVNKAIQELVEARFGAASWERIRARAGVDDEVFIGGETYDDDVTYRLVTAATEELKVPAAEILEAFGIHWVIETAQKNYGHLMEAVGTNLADFLTNLPRLHDRVVLLFPKLKPPTFKVRDRQENRLVLEYHTHRPGLQPFVLGLVKGLGLMFETPVTVSLDAGRHTGLNHDEFTVSWTDPQKRVSTGTPGPLPTSGRSDPGPAR
jgi:hypothetical protein